MNSYEIAARIVWIFAKAVDYCSKEELASSEEQVQPRLQRADAILEMLSEWEAILPPEFTPLPGVGAVDPGPGFEPLWIHPPAFGMLAFR